MLENVDYKDYLKKVVQSNHVLFQHNKHRICGHYQYGHWY